MLTSLFSYDLPEDLVAQRPTPLRSDSRLMGFCRHTGEVEHGYFRNFHQYLRSGDALILNNSKVFPARLRGEKPASGGKLEILLLDETSPNRWWALLRPGKRVRAGGEIGLRNRQNEPIPWKATVLEKNAEGHCLLQFDGAGSLIDEIHGFGEVPLPPYIDRQNQPPDGADQERYQTVYAESIGSVAAPTAGLHFTRDLLDALQDKGVRIGFVTLHVGYGTFSPVQTEDPKSHKMHSERFEFPEETAQLISEVKSSGGRIVAVGTTSLRVLESLANEDGKGIEAGKGKTSLFIYPPCDFHCVDALLTNFHLPRSTLLMLVSAFASPGKIVGRERILAAYREAVQRRYRFFSYGDAMFLHD